MKAKGFLIVDVVVSTVVIMTMLIPILNIFIIVKENNEYYERAQEVHRILDYKIEEILSEDFKLDDTGLIVENLVSIELVKTPTDYPDIYKVMGEVYYNGKFFTNIEIYKFEGDYDG